jgi:hypothetical protein
MKTLELIYPRLISRAHLRSSSVAQWTLCGKRLDPNTVHACQVAHDGRACARCIRVAAERGFACPVCRVVLIGLAAQTPCPRCAATKAKTEKGSRDG